MTLLNGNFDVFFFHREKEFHAVFHAIQNEVIYLLAATVLNGPPGWP